MNYLLQITCNFCQPNIRVFTAKKQATTSLLKHLRAEHSGEAPEDLAKTPKLSTASNQSTIDFRITSDVKSTKIENFLKKFIIHNGLPLLLVDSQSFRNLVRNLNSRIHIPSRKSLKNDIMKNYSDTKSVIKQQLSNKHSKISLALDICTADTMQPYLAITYHFVVPDGSLTTKLLSFKQLPGSHTGENIFHAFQEHLNDFSALPENIMAIWMDNATNNRPLPSHLDYGQIHEIRCFAHVLNLA